MNQDSPRIFFYFEILKGIQELNQPKAVVSIK